MKQTLALFVLIAIAAAAGKPETNTPAQSQSDKGGVESPVSPPEVALVQPPLPAPPPVEQKKPEGPEYRLVMLTATWCPPCKLMKRQLEMGGFVLSDGMSVTTHDKRADPKGNTRWTSEYRKTDVMTVDIEKHPDWINGRKSNLIPQFILQKKDGEDWKEIRSRIGTYPVGDHWKLWPELPKKNPPKEQHASGDGSVRKKLCGCDGDTPGCCLCLQEIDAGRRTSGCGCSSEKSSEHYVNAQGEPIGATGRYVQTHTITASSRGVGGKWCSKCRRYH